MLSDPELVNIKMIFKLYDLFFENENNRNLRETNKKY